MTQDVVLFNDTVAVIAYGAQYYSHEEIIQAAQVANAHEFIENLPDRYQTLIGERGSVLIRRAAGTPGNRQSDFKNPPIIILG